MTDVFDNLCGEQFRDTYKRIQNEIAERTLTRRAIVKSHVEYHQAMLPKAGPCGFSFDEIVAVCPVCRRKNSND